MTLKEFRDKYFNGFPTVKFTSSEEPMQNFVNVELLLYNNFIYANMESLDFENAEAVFSMLLKQSRQAGVAAIIATHNLELAKKLDRIFLIENGSLSSV